MPVKSTLKNALKIVGLEVHRVPTDNDRVYAAISLLHSANDGAAWSRRFLSCAVKYLNLSRSQLMQDLFALSAVDKRNGYFVEFGGGDGITYSNTYMLETAFGWTGIVAEPSKAFAPKIAAVRRCAVDNRCVWSASGEKLSFTEVQDRRELSSLSQFAKWGLGNANRYTVETISLNDLLEEHKAPTEIDYLSIDAEGSELEILRATDFNRWPFKVITVECGYMSGSRAAVYNLLTANGYTRLETQLSQWEDWYLL